MRTALNVEVVRYPCHWIGSRLKTGLKLEIPDERTPEREFDRDWAHALLRRVIEGLEESCRAEGGILQFEQLRATLTTDSARVPYAELAAKLDMTEGAARVAVHRLRKRYRHLLRDRDGRTLVDPGSVEEEMRSLFSAFGRLNVWRIFPPNE